MPKLCITPRFDGEDRGDGGIRRVVEAQREWLPQMGWALVDDPLEADLVATHASVLPKVPATTPLVSHCHGLYWHGYAWERWALKMNLDVIKAMRQADVVTAPSKWVAHAIARGTNIIAPVLYHGINPDDWEPGTNLGYVLWNKTRYDPICDPTPLGRLAELAPGVQFVTSVDWNLPKHDNITATGILSYARSKDVIRGAGVYLATTRETFGIGTLEAMAAGVPVLGWNWGGQAEIVTHGVDGWLTEPDDYDGLLAGLLWCMAERDTVGLRARARVLRDFTWEIAMSRYDALYRGLLEPHVGPTLSIVIPAYNMEDTLHETVHSILAQDFDDLEIIIVDDSSTDQTATIADNLAEVAAVTGSPVQIEVIHNAKNLYLAEALNTGIAASSGRYILPLDADNMLGTGRDILGLLVGALDGDRSFDIAYGAMSVIDPTGRDEEWVSTWPGQFDFRRQMIHQNQIPSTSMYRRRAWERVGGYRRRCRTAEDADFWCRATSFGANAKKVTDAVVLRYRNRPDSMSHAVADWAWNDWYAWSKPGKADLTPWIAPVAEMEKFQPTIPMFERCLVSVVIPVGPGHERFVLDALDSLRSQTFIWWEAIVVNDTGADLPWVPAWARVVSTSDTGHVGAGAARNVGMVHARGRLFLFLDADDYLQPEALELMVTEQIRVGGFVYSDWYRQETGEHHRAPEWDGCQSVLRQLPWPVTCLYPRSAWDATGGFDETLFAWEDWDFALRVVRAGYCGTRVATPLFHYRMDAGSRREAGFANREELKLEILKRWSTYIEGGVEMPCGCSGGGGLPSLPALDLFALANPQSLPPNPNDDTIMLEFTGDVAAPISYTGQSTGTRYKFGSDPDHRVRYVYRADAERLLNREEFREYNSGEASKPLAAAGPPFRP